MVETISSASAMRRHLGGVVVGVLLVLTVAIPGWAHGGGGASGPPPGPSELAPGPVKRAILDLQKKVRELGGGEELVDEPLASALRAAERARGARAASDAPHAALLDKLAEQWIAAAAAVLRAVSIERAAEAAASRQRDLKTKVERAEALLTEQQARLGRLRAELRKAEEHAKGASARSTAAEKKRVQPAVAKERSKSPGRRVPESRGGQ